MTIERTMTNPAERWFVNVVFVRAIYGHVSRSDRRVPARQAASRIRQRAAIIYRRQQLTDTTAAAAQPELVTVGTTVAAMCVAWCIGSSGCRNVNNLGLGLTND